MRLPRLYPILDTGLCERLGLDPVESARAMLDAGAGILQLRHKGFFSREMFAQAARIKADCTTAGVEFVINDRADLALLLDCGLHVGQDDLPPAMARRLIGPRLLGFSTHNEAQLRAALGEPVDYLAIGPIFGTGSKLKADPVVGTTELQRLRALVTDRPLVAIGGITRSTARAVIEAGADSVAVIADLMPSSFDESNAPLELGARLREWMAALEFPG